MSGQQPRLVAVALSALLTAALTGCTPTFEPVPSAQPHSASDVPTSAPATEPPIIDSGPTDGAMGDAAQLPDGTWRYTAVEGDVGGLICDRFDRAWWQMEYPDAGQGLNCNTMINPGTEVILNNAERVGS